MHHRSDRLMARHADDFISRSPRAVERRNGSLPGQQLGILTRGGQLRTNIFYKYHESPHQVKRRIVQVIV